MISKFDHPPKADDRTKIIGTDIHRHTVEFSKNTRTPSRSEPVVRPAPGQPFQPITFYLRAATRAFLRHPADCLRTSCPDTVELRTSRSGSVSLLLERRLSYAPANGPSNPLVNGP